MTHFWLGFAGGLVVHIVQALARLVLQRRTQAKRAAAPKFQTRPVVPIAAPHAQPGSLPYIAHVIDRELPAGSTGVYRVHEDPRINIGHVAVTFSVGSRFHKEGQ